MILEKPSLVNRYLLKVVCLHRQSLIELATVVAAGVRRLLLLLLEGMELGREPLLDMLLLLLLQLVVLHVAAVRRNRPADAAAGEEEWDT